MTDTVIAEIIGGSVTLVTTLVTTLFAYLTNRPAPPALTTYGFPLSLARV